jgi:hypothetical protein
MTRTLLIFEGPSRESVVSHALRRLRVIIPWTQARSALANAVKDGESPERVAELRTAYRAARTAQLLRELLSVRPPLSDEQRRELADVVLGGGADVAA